MAKRTNLLLTVQRELENGKIFIDNDGYFCTQEEVTKKKKDAYLKALKEDTTLIDKGITLDKFNDVEYFNTTDVLNTIIDNLFSKQTVLVKGTETQTTETTETANTADSPNEEKEKSKGGK